MDSLWRELSLGVGVAAILSFVVWGLEPFLGVLSLLFLLLSLPVAFVLAWMIPKLRPSLLGATVPAAIVAGVLINFGPVPAGSLGPRVAYYAQLAYYRQQLDAQCNLPTSCRDPSRVQTMITEGFGSIVQGLARDDSGSLLRARERNEPAPVPLTGCESGIVHLFGPYFHFSCG